MHQDAAEAKDDETVEHKLEWSELHQQFLGIFEEQISDFLDTRGVCRQTFYSQCEDAIEDRYTALFEEHMHHWFVDALLSSMSYEHFFSMMTRQPAPGVSHK